nr:40_t:CDS:2 [Entrophospora candida]
MNVNEESEIQEVVRLLTEQPIIDYSKVKDIYEVAKKLRARLRLAYTKIKWGLHKCDMATCERMVEQKLQDYKNFPNKKRVHIPFHVSPVPPSKNGFTGEKAKAVYEILDSLTHKPKPNSNKMRHNSVDPYLNQIQQNCDGAYTTNNNTDLNSNINLSNNSIYLNSYNNVNFNNTNTNLDTNNVNISNLNLNIDNNNISNFNPNSRNISYNNYYYDPWNLNTTNLRSTASPSRRRKADWDDANLKQKVQKSSPCKENFNSVLSSPSYNKQKEPIQCPGTPPNQIISINETKTPDTAFSLSEYLNMSPM